MGSAFKLVVFLAAAAAAVALLLSPASGAGDWQPAHATFYGNTDPNESRSKRDLHLISHLLSVV